MDNEIVLLIIILVNLGIGNMAQGEREHKILDKLEEIESYYKAQK